MRKVRILQDFKKYCNYLVYATKFQLKTEVANSYLNWIWWLLEPIMDMCLYTLVFGFFFKSTIEKFPVFVFIGITMWGFMSKTINQSTSLIKNNLGVISKVYMPKQMLLIKSMMVNAFKMMVSFGVTFILFLVYGIKVNICLLYVIPILVEMFVFIYGVGCFFMHFGVYVDDLNYIVSILLQMLMFISGIFYSIPDRVSGSLSTILLSINPVAFFIHSMRLAAMYRIGIDKVIFICWFFIAAVLAVAGTNLIYKNENNYVKVL